MIGGDRWLHNTSFSLFLTLFPEIPGEDKGSTDPGVTDHSGAHASPPGCHVTLRRMELV